MRQLQQHIMLASIDENDIPLDLADITKKKDLVDKNQAKY